MLNLPDILYIYTELYKLLCTLQVSPELQYAVKLETRPVAVLLRPRADAW